MKLFALATLSCSLPLFAARDCQGLASKFNSADTSIRFARSAEPGTMLGPGNQLVKTPAFCRVVGALHPSPDSDIHFEVWLPENVWNAKFRGTGNGGFAGSINYAEMAAAIRDGYATASTDTGHRADGIDSSWALGHPEKVKDFGYRAIHETAAKAKAIIEAYYGEPAKHSYFAACSNGGRQALMEAERFPEDYDGILAGAPAYYWTHLLIAGLYNAGRRMDENPAAYVPKEKIPAIARAVLDACDAKDGLKDGIVSDPRDCHFDPATIACHSAATDNCLTAPQVETVKLVYGGAHASDGTLVFPGYDPGGEDGRGGWQAWITGEKPGTSLGNGFSLGFLRNLVFEDTRWTAKGTDLVQTLKIADDKLAGTMNATDPNLKPFASRGGKLIMYHGWSDAAIPPRNAISYFDSVAGKPGAQEPNNFARLYMAPGMQHCSGGPGPNLFGQFGVFKPGDAQHDVFTALVDWVEKGGAPGAIIAAKYSDVAKPAEMTRPLCPYPQVAKYSGSGDFNDAANFSCVAP